VRGGFEERHQPWGFIDAVADVAGDVVGAVVDVASYAGEADDLWEGAVEIVEGVGEAFTDFVGEVDKFAFGSVDVTVDLTLNYTDPAFEIGTPALRARGPLKGQRLVLDGATVWIKQWNDLLLPESFHTSLHESGQVTLEVAKNNATRGESGLCVELENDFGMVSPFLTATEICDFRHRHPRPGVPCSQHAVFTSSNVLCARVCAERPIVECWFAAEEGVPRLMWKPSITRELRSKRAPHQTRVRLVAHPYLELSRRTQDLQQRDVRSAVKSAARRLH
jgi:hypothetical protein